MNKKKMEEKILATKEWKKVDGWAIDHNNLSEGDVTYVPDLREIGRKCTYYTEIDRYGQEGELAYEDITEIWFKERVEKVLKAQKATTPSKKKAKQEA